MSVIGTKNAAIKLGLTPTRVAVLIRTGQLRAVKVGRDWVIDEKDLQDFAKQKRPPGRPSKKNQSHR